MQSLTWQRAVDALWLSVLTVYVLAGVALVPLHGDESTLIYMGRDFYYQVVQGDSSAVAYRDNPDVIEDGATQQQLRLMNGTVPKYLYGAVAYFSGYDLNEINDQWVWGAGWDWNHANGHVPPDDLLYRARLVSALLTAVGAWALFGAGYIVRGRGAAYVASGYYALHPAILLNGRRAMMEGGLLAFGLLVILAGVLVMKYRRWWLYVLLGVMSGLAVASKHTAVIYVIAVFLAAGAYFIWHRSKENQRITRAIGGLMSAGVLSLLVFYALNPAWWGDPVTRAQQVLTMRTDFMVAQVSAFESYETFSEQITGFIMQVFIVPPMYSETPVDNFVANQQRLIATYEQSLFNGVHPGMAGAVITGVFALAGCVALWRDTALHEAGRWLLIMLVGCVGAFVLLLTPLPWQRYYLPLYPVAGLLMAVGVCYLWDGLYYALSDR
jgi:4-amino-4-deoxy-L-arabinose transferase-like glycosyltransferase